MPKNRDFWQSGGSAVALLCFVQLEHVQNSNDVVVVDVSDDHKVELLLGLPNLLQRILDPVVEDSASWSPVD
jgi:hypothetical protein